VGSRRIAIPALLIALFGACAWPAAGSGQVLYRTSARLSRLTVSAGRMAWAQQVSGSTCVRIFRRPELGGPPTRVTKCRVPSRPVGAAHAWIRFAGSQVFWEETGVGNTEVDEFVYSTLPGGRRSPTVYTINCGGTAGFGKLLDTAATGALVYSVFTVHTDGACSPLSGTGVVRRTVVAGGHAQRILVPGAPGAALLAVSGRSLLEAPGVVASFGIEPGQTLELRGLRSGTRRWSAASTGTLRALALSPSYAAALVRTASGKARIRAYAAASGSLVRSIPVKATALPMVAMVGPRVVFADPGRIMVWNVRTDGLHVLRRTQATVHNLLADGRMVAWNTVHTIRGIRLAPAG
jgi:hypothetical protein